MQRVAARLFFYAGAGGPVFDYERDVTAAEAGQLDTLKKGLEN